MFKALLKKQLMEMGAFLTNNGKTGRRRSAKAALGYTLFFALMMLVLMGSFGTVAWQAAEELLPAGLDWMYFLSMELTGLMMAVIVGVFMGYSALFAAKDNELLLAMPIPPWMILAVRLFGLLVVNVGCILLVWVPTVVVYAVQGTSPLGAVVSALPVVAILGGISSVLSAILGWIVAEAGGRVRHRNIVTVVLSLGFLGGCYAAVSWIESLLPQLLTGENAAEPHGLLYCAGRAAQGDGGLLLGFAVAVAAITAAFCFLLDRQYLRLMTTRRGVKKTVYRAKMTQKSSLRRALLRRELLHLASSPAYLLNCALGTGMLLVVGGMMLVKSQDIYASVSALFPAELLPLLLCGMVCIGLASNLLAAPSVSLEGKNLWLIRSLPVTAWQALRAKLDLHLLFTVVPAVVCTLCGGFAFRVRPGTLLLILLVVLLFSGFAALFDLTAGLLWANLHWTNETAVIKQSMFSAVAMLGSWAAGTLLVAGGMLLLHVLPEEAVLTVCGVLLAAADALLCRWVKGQGSARFEEL